MDNVCTFLHYFVLQIKSAVPRNGGNMWLLTYGNADCEPKVVTVVSEKELGHKITGEEKRAVNIARRIVAGTDIPMNFIRFRPESNIDKVLYWEPGMDRIRVISSSELKNRFSRYGLKMNRLMAQKSINDKSSSPYHDWQRNNMGSAVIVADIDLLRVKGNEPTEILELKRSYISVDNWKPFRQDYNNFILLSKLARRRDIDFYIIYNRRNKNPFIDDVSRVKIFEFDHRMRTFYRLIGMKTIQQFAYSTKGETR